MMLNEALKYHFKLIDKHFNLINEVYQSGFILQSEVNKRAIYDLSENKILFATSSGYRLSPDILDYLNKVSNKRTHFEKLFDNSKIEQLSTITNSYFEVLSTGGDVDDLKKSFSNVSYAIYHEINNAIHVLRSSAENRFADVSFVERKAENEFFSRKANEMCSTIDSLAIDGLLAQQLDYDSDLYVIYDEQIGRNLSSWRSIFLEVTEILKKYYFEQRKIERNVKRIGSFVMFMKNNSDYDFYPILNSFEFASKGTEQFVRSDIFDINVRENLIVQIDKGFFDVKKKEATAKKIGKLNLEKSLRQINLVEIVKEREIDILYSRLLNSLIELQRISVIEWFFLNKRNDEVDIAEWVWFLFEMNNNNKYTFDPVYKKNENKLCANRIISDMFIMKNKVESNE